MEMTPFRVSGKGADLACLRFGEGPPLLLAHPVLFSKAFYAAAADIWGARFTCVAFDQRCHGDTRSTTLTPAGLAEDVGAILDHLKWDKAALGGTSFGAASTLSIFSLLSGGPGFAGFASGGGAVSGAVRS